MNFEQALARFIPQIEAEMRRVMAPPHGDLNPFYGMMHYHLGWLDETFQPVQVSSGKLLRPLFTLLCCQAAGGRPEQALTAAAAVELVHNFSLIHDDIEDNSRTRRGRLTVWAIWGEPQAINAGDGLFVLARHTLLKLREQGVADPTIFAALERLDQTCLALCQGQYLDMSFERTLTVDLKAYLEMIEGKTAALLACSGYLGGLIAMASPARAEIFWQLGRALGLAFQIQDDLLGIWGQEAVTGKPAADDLRRRKKSLPVVYALNQADRPQAARFRELYSAATLGEADVAEAITLLEEIGAKRYTEAQAKAYVEAAKSALQAIEAPPENKVSLEEMAYFFIERVH
ncbi:MAG: polyprenyl synthetase family protein [Anaerolineales bacterium]|nr:polyprenyl synthetase family protein [Anaerolineales bacterium]